MARDREIELKLAIHPADVAAFRRLALLRGKGIDPPTRRQVFCVYFDTPGRALKKHAMALRLCKIGGRWRQTLKTAGNATGGLHERGEWEFPSSACQLDLALFRETPLATLAGSKELHLRLKPIFTTEFQRTAWRVDISPGRRVEVALDQGVIRCGDRESPISEVEIELLKGGVAAVFDWALALAGQIALKPAILSKAERGYRLFRPEPLAPRRAGNIELKRNWIPQQAMRAIVAACLDHFEGNVDGALERDDPEYIHQLRVALRRLRSAMRIFTPVQDAPIFAEMKWLAIALGDARNWDVLITETLPALLDAYADPRLATELMGAATQRQAAARAGARAALASPREALLVLAVARRVRVHGEHVPPSLRAASDDGATHGPPIHSLCQFASHEIHRRHRLLLRSKGALAGLSAEALHRVRIDVKRLRYAVDFFASLFGKHRVARYLKVLDEIQTLLGEANDDTIAITLVQSLAPPERFVDFARGWFAARTQARRARIDRHLAGLKSVKHFWGKNTVRTKPDGVSVTSDHD